MSCFKRSFPASLSAIALLGIGVIACHDNDADPAPALKVESVATKTPGPISRKARRLHADSKDSPSDASSCRSREDHSLVVQVGSTGVEDLTEGEIHYLNLELQDRQSYCHAASDGGPVTVAVCEQLP